MTTVEFDPAPAACGHRRLAQGVCVPAGQGEVPVVAEPDQALPAGGIHVTVGEFGRVQRDGQRVREQRADRDRAAAGVVDRHSSNRGGTGRLVYRGRPAAAGGPGQRVQTSDKNSGEVPGAGVRSTARRR
jgi:hypothetical protein